MKQDMDPWACGYANSSTATKHSLFDDCNLKECYRVETSFGDPRQKALFNVEHPWDKVILAKTKKPNLQSPTELLNFVPRFGQNTATATLNFAPQEVGRLVLPPAFAILTVMPT